MTHYEDPRELQVVWRWSHKERRPIEVQYLGRNRTWRKWRRGDHTPINKRTNQPPSRRPRWAIGRAGIDGWSTHGTEV